MSEDPELPRPSPELIAIRCLLEAHVRTMGTRRRARFLAEAIRIFREVDAPVLSLRSTADLTLLDHSRHSARVWFDRVALRMLERR